MQHILAPEGRTMTRIEWDPALCTGDDHVDSEHRALYALVAEMDDLIEAGETDEVVEASLTRVLTYAHEHFRHEEELMARIGYPDLERHRLLHTEFAAEAERLSIERLAGVHFSAEGLADFMHAWLNTHVGTEDRKIGSFIRESENSER